MTGMKSKNFLSATTALTAVLLLGSCASNTRDTTGVAPTQPRSAVTAKQIQWSGYTWNVTNGGMAGVAQGSENNVFVDADGYLHMKITNNSGTWTAAEIFSTTHLGFGTYQWQIDGPVDKLDKNIVVGLFPYGPAAGMGYSGLNEIDIEFARWGNNAWPNGNFTIWPPTGTRKGSHTFDFTLSGTYTTSTFIWASDNVWFGVQEGFKAIGDNSNMINQWTYRPSDPTTAIPQQAFPLGMNLWCFGAPPSDGNNVEIIVRKFTFTPLGQVPVQFTITAQAGSGGSIDPSGTSTVDAGADRTFTFRADSGWSISAVLVDGIDQGVRNSYTFRNVQKDHAIRVEFTKNTPTQYTISASAGEGGSISPSGNVTVEAGSAHTFTFQADQGYAVAAIVVDGEDLGMLESYTFESVSQGHTIRAEFSASTGIRVIPRD